MAGTASAMRVYPTAPGCGSEGSEWRNGENVSNSELRGNMRKNSVKNTRINGEVQRVLAEIIRGEIKDPRISPWTSVVSVEVAPDLKSCKAWISVLGNEDVRKATLQGLKSAEGFIKRQLAKTINLRNTPEITFVMDQSIEYGVNMSRKIDEVIAMDSENAGNDEGVDSNEDTGKKEGVGNLEEDDTNVCDGEE